MPELANKSIVTSQRSVGMKSRKGTGESFGDDRHIRNHLGYDHDFIV